MKRPSACAVLTGASRGIGAATAEALAAQGWRLALGCRNAGDCQPTVERIRARGSDAIAVDCDVCEFEQVVHLIEAAVDRFGGVSTLVNNAGTMDPISRIEDSNPTDWEHGIAVNLLGTYHGIRAALPAIESAGGGTIVNLSSGAASHPLSGWGAYCAGKAAVAMLTRVLATELAESDVRVYGFRPGMVNTRLTREALRIQVNTLSDLDPAEFDNPELPGRAIAWLCTERPADLHGGEPDLQDPAFRQRLGIVDP